MGKKKPLIVGIIISVFIFMIIGVFYNTPSIIQEESILLKDNYSCASIHVERIPLSTLYGKPNFLRLSLLELTELPILKDTIDKTNKMEFGLNEKSIARVSFEEFKEYYVFIANKTSEQNPNFTYYVGEAYDVWYIGPTEESFLIQKEIGNRIYPPGWTSVNIPLLPIRYDDTTYYVGMGVSLSRVDRPPQHIPIGLNNDYEGKVVNLSKSDMEQIPKLFDAIQKIGTVETSVYAYSSFSTESEWSQYMEWLKNKNFAKTSIDARPSGILYNGNYYNISFSIC